MAYVLLFQPHHGLPDIFIWMLSGGKRIAYTRVPAGDVLWSQEDSQCGLQCGTAQTLFMKVCHRDFNLHCFIVKAFQRSV